MRFEISSPCDEPWESMALRPSGRYCGRCEKTVIDLSTMTRRQAEHRLRGMGGREVCVQLAVDRSSGDAVFRVPPSRAPHWAGGLVLVAALTAGGCSTADEPSAGAEISAVAPVELGPPMTPVVLASLGPSTESVVTGPVPASELDAIEGPVRPTAEQRRLTQNKRRPTVTVPPNTHMMRGGMAHYVPIL